MKGLDKRSKDGRQQQENAESADKDPKIKLSNGKLNIRLLEDLIDDDPNKQKEGESNSSAGVAQQEENKSENPSQFRNPPMELEGSDSGSERGKLIRRKQKESNQDIMASLGRPIQENSLSDILGNEEKCSEFFDAFEKGLEQNDDLWAKYC